MTINNWQEVEKMIEKIMNYCMGGALYNAVINNNINLEYSPTNPDSQYDANTQTITLANLFNYGVLTQEIFHYYQKTRIDNTKWNQTGANIEVEAHLAQFLLLERSGVDVEKTYRTKYELEIRFIRHFIDDKANITESSKRFFYEGYQDAMNIYKAAVPSIGMSISTSDMNLDNLQSLSRGC